MDAGAPPLRSAEEALRESEYRYRNLFQAMAASFWELDFAAVGNMLRDLRRAGIADFAVHFADHPELVRTMMRATRVLDVNDETLKLFGRGDKAELLGTIEPFWPEASNHVFAASVVSAVSGRPSFVTECKLRRIDGQQFDALFTACFPPESVSHGKLLVGVIDISERVSAQAMLRQVQAEFAHAARVSMLGELTASIAHEVNQPLAAIATNAAAGLRWLDRPQPDIEEVRILTKRIIADAQRAAEIIARVRTMAAHRVPEATPLSLNAVVEEAMVFLAHELQAQSVALTLSLQRGLPRVLADRTQLQQVVVNLAVNAIQAMGQVAPEERRLTVRTAREGDGVMAAVEDSGPGIAEADRARLFESFYTTKASGMGMGLPICRSILDGCGGTIRVRNMEAGGAAFAFTLPAVP